MGSRDTILLTLRGGKGRVRGRKIAVISRRDVNGRASARKVHLWDVEQALKKAKPAPKIVVSSTRKIAKSEGSEREAPDRRSGRFSNKQGGVIRSTYMPSCLHRPAPKPPGRYRGCVQLRIAPAVPV